MTLAQLRNASLIVSVLVIMLIAPAVLSASHRVTEAVDVNRSVDYIRSGINELNYLTVDTILHGEERSRRQWKRRHQTLSDSLDAMQLGAEHASYLGVIDRNLEGAQILYLQLEGYRDALNRAALESGKYRELEARAVSRLLGQFHDMNAASTRMSELSLQRIANAQKVLGWMSVAFVALIALIVTTNWYLISQRVLRRISILESASRCVAAGDLEFRTGFSAVDEVGRLSVAFDAMTARVQSMLAQMEMEIARRTAAQQELLESREQIRAVMETAPDAIITMDDNGRIVLFNEGAEAMFACSREEAHHMQWEQFVTEQAQIGATAIQVDSRKAGVEAFEIMARRRNGEEFPAELSIAKWGTTRGRFATAIVRDISERKRAEEQLKSSNRELEAFSYSVSHDLRAPLRHIAGFITLLEEECSSGLSNECREYVRYATEAATQMGALIDDLLEFSRFGRIAFQVERFDMRELVNETLARMENEFSGRNIQVTVHTMPGVTGDRAMIRQVWLNLLSNAIKYTRPRPKAVIEIGCMDQRGDAVWFIRDNGVGFDMHFADKLFGVFQRLHRAEEFEGTGVGLANVRRIVERHGGRVWAQSKPDCGATFYFTLSGQGAK